MMSVWIIFYVMHHNYIQREIFLVSRSRIEEVARLMWHSSLLLSLSIASRCSSIMFSARIASAQFDFYNFLWFVWSIVVDLVLCSFYIFVFCSGLVKIMVSKVKRYGDCVYWIFQFVWLFWISLMGYSMMKNANADHTSRYLSMKMMPYGSIIENTIAIVLTTYIVICIKM